MQINFMNKLTLAFSALLCACTLAGSEEIGRVDTAFQWIGPDHGIVVEAYDDPKVSGVTCYVSRAKTGGIKGGLGLAEDRAEASIASRQDGPVHFGDKRRPSKKRSSASACHWCSKNCAWCAWWTPSATPWCT